MPFAGEEQVPRRVVTRTGPASPALPSHLELYFHPGHKMRRLIMAFGPFPEAFAKARHDAPSLRISLQFRSLAACSFFVLSTFYGAIRKYSPVPYWNMWDGYIGFYDRVSAGDWRSWLIAHNEHRMIPEWAGSTAICSMERKHSLRMPEIASVHGYSRQQSSQRIRPLDGAGCRPGYGPFAIATMSGEVRDSQFGFETVETPRRPSAKPSGMAIRGDRKQGGENSGRSVELRAERGRALPAIPTCI